MTNRFFALAGAGDHFEPSLIPTGTAVGLGTSFETVYESL
jgi:hypothetical protein